MRINFKAVLTALNGEPHEKNGMSLTLGDVTIDSLMLILEADRAESGEPKFRRFQIAEKVKGNGEVELTHEDVTLIKQRIGLAYGSAIVGSAYKILNGQPT